MANRSVFLFFPEICRTTMGTWVHRFCPDSKRKSAYWIMQRRLRWIENGRPGFRLSRLHWRSILFALWSIFLCFLIVMYTRATGFIILYYVMLLWCITVYANFDFLDNWCSIVLFTKINLLSSSIYFNTFNSSFTYKEIYLMIRLNLYRNKWLSNLQHSLLPENKGWMIQCSATKRRKIVRISQIE